MRSTRHFRNRKKSKPSGDIATGKSLLFRRVKGQLPTLTAILVSAIVTRIEGYTADIYGIIVLILLTAVIYTALHRGARQGVTSALLATAYNAYLLAPSIQTFAFDDRSISRILLITTILLAVAGIVGRLKERNDLSLIRETKARIRAEISEERLRFMAESMPQKIFTAKPNGDMDYINPQWTDFTGLDFKQIRNQGWAQFIHSDDIGESGPRWRRSLDTGKPFQFEHRLRRADGVYRWHLTRAKALSGNKGQIVLWIGSSTDIEDVRRTRKLEASTARLIEQRAQLLALNKAKDEFISLASHQLRTPATGVKQYVGMLLEGYAGKVTRQQQDMLKHAYESNERQLAIVDDLLKIAQLDAGKVRLRKEKVNMVALLKDILHEQTSKFAERKQTVVFAPGRRSVTAVIDSHRMRMVLENVIDNASKYTPPQKKIEIRLSKARHHITITVEDEGVGIDKKDKDKIFHKFSRLDNSLSVSVGGSGLGLYWVKKIIDLHDGSVEVTSELDKGSLFTIKLPA